MFLIVSLVVSIGLSEGIVPSLDGSVYSRMLERAIKSFALSWFNLIRLSLDTIVAFSPVASLKVVATGIFAVIVSFIFPWISSVLSKSCCEVYMLNPKPFFLETALNAYIANWFAIFASASFSIFALSKDIGRDLYIFSPRDLIITDAGMYPLSANVSLMKYLKSSALSSSGSTPQMLLKSSPSFWSGSIYWTEYIFPSSFISSVLIISSA